MADHVGQQILDAIETQLTGLVTTGNNVYRSRPFPLHPSKTPALQIYPGAMDPDRESDAGLKDGGIGEFWMLSVLVDVVVTGPDSIAEEKQSWKIQKEVEAILYADKSLGGLAKDLQLTGVSAPEPNGQGSQVVLSKTMDWTILFRIKQGVPDVAIQ